MTGLSYAKGDLVWLLDSDLEEEPEWFIDFYDKFKNNEVDLVYGVQKKRRGNFLDKIPGKIYYSFINFGLESKFVYFVFSLLILSFMILRFSYKDLIKHFKIFFFGWKLRKRKKKTR